MDDKEGDLPNRSSDDAAGSNQVESVDSDVKPQNSEEASESGLQNHVDHDNDDTSNAGVRIDTESDALEVDAQKDKNDDELKEESRDQNSQDAISQTSQDSTEKNRDAEDEIGKPNFETAPNISMEEAQEDHSQALDPFDALLKDTSDAPVQAEPTMNSKTTSTVNIDDDDVGQADSSVTQEEEDPPAESTPIEDSSTSLSLEEPGADEEICLLPDTEREISEADKAAAELVLAEKRKQAEDAAAVPIPKEENEAMDTDPSREDVEPSSHMDMQTDGPSQENGGDKEGDPENEEPVEIDENLVPIVIQEINPIDGPCIQCKIEQPCSFRFVKNGDTCYVCNEPCVKGFQAEFPGKFSVTRKKYLIEEIQQKTLQCSECEESKTCYFYYNFDGEDTYYCSMACLEGMMADEKEQYAFKRRRITIEQGIPTEATCLMCNQDKTCTFALSRYGKQHHLCGTNCIKTLNGLEGGRYYIKKTRVPRVQPIKLTPLAPAPAPPAAPAAKTPLLKLKVISNATDKYLDEGYKIQAKTPAMVQAARDERERTFLRKCSHCTLILTIDEKVLTWETMDFCDEICLGRYQNKIGSRCANCKNVVQHTSLGKYCVRFGYDIRQFCNSGCLEEFKKGLKICCYCQRDISAGHQGFLAPVGDKGQFKDFCTQQCMEKFDHMNKNPVPQPIWAKCAVCSLEKATTIEVEVSETATQRLCSEPCFAAFKFVNNVFPDQCRWCKKYFERRLLKNFTIYDGSSPQCFCTKSCMNVFISNTRHIVPCNWCKVKKYNFDMIRRVQANGQVVMMCSLNCLNLYQVSVNAVSSRKTKCDMCKRTSLAQYHLTMSDATVRNFCTYQCVMSFQGQYSKHPPLMPGEAIDQQKAVPTGVPRRTYSANCTKNKAPATTTQRTTTGMPVISNVQSLAAPPPLMPTLTRGKSKRLAQAPPPPPPEPEPPAAPKTPPTPTKTPHTASSTTT